MNESQFKYYENNISKIQKHSKYKKNNICGKEFNTHNKDKEYETIDTYKNKSDKKIKNKEKKDKMKTNNLMTFKETKKQICSKKDNIRNNYNKKKIKSKRENNNTNNIKNINNNNIKNLHDKTSKKNILGHKYFYSTFTEII